MVPKDHACRVKGPLLPSFKPTDGIRAVTKVIVFQENWIEDRFAIETPSGVFVPDTKPLDTTPFNDPGCFGGNVISIESVTATGKDVDVVYTDAWRNDRTYYGDDGGITYSSSQDDTAKVRLACSPAGDRLTCRRNELSRVCHVDGSSRRLHVVLVRGSPDPMP